MTTSPEAPMLNCDWVPMPALAITSTADAVLPLRVRYRQEMNGQIVHDSIHRRDGWKVTYILQC